ncbi:MAG TPA: hypothetical protein VGY58_19985, partial [Gemmataceae bacterium]|nr:hypothetical protein [Gemmataceae bacterium]
EQEKTMRRLWYFCFCLCLVSCSSNKQYGSHPPYPTSGQLLVNGEPAADANVLLFHLDDWGERSILPQAWTDEEGRFVLSTYGDSDGAPAGDYQVAVEWPAYRKGKNWGPDKLGGKFAKPATSGLKAHVEKGTNELPPFNLKVTLAKVKKGKER